MFYDFVIQPLALLLSKGQASQSVKANNKYKPIIIQNNLNSNYNNRVPKNMAIKTI